MLTREVAGSIALVDVNKSKLEGEAKDLRQGSAFHQRVRVEASDDYSISADSHLVIVTAGVAQKVGESRLSLVERNVKIMKSIIPQVLKYSPDAPICIVSNPCDIMTAVAAKIAGPSVPAGRIFGSGTCLDSSRLRSLIAKALDIDSRSVHGYIIGEHGDSSIPAWSAVRVGGIPFLKVGEEPSDIHKAMHREVVESAGDVIALKGYTNWAVGLTAAHIAHAVVTDSRSILPISTCVRGLYGIDHDVFLSLPCNIGATGVRRVLSLPLTETEKTGFKNSAETVWSVQKGVWDSV
jgi:L-lactate dehydrogenase